MNDNNDKNYTTVIIYLIIKNIVAICSFTILAIFFQKWWIALFSLLFYSTVSKENKEKQED